MPQNFLIYGQPGSGKTTLAYEVAHAIKGDKFVTHLVIDGDDLRSVTDNQNYGRDGRMKNMENACLVAKLMNHKGVGAILSVVCPYKEMREYVKKQLPGIILVQLQYDRNVIERGREHYWVEDFEVSMGCHLVIDTGRKSIESATKIITEYAESVRDKNANKSKI